MNQSETWVSELGPGIHASFLALMFGFWANPEPDFFNESNGVLGYLGA